MNVSKMFSLEGKVALITGGSSGIGFAIGRISPKQARRLRFAALKKNRLKKAWQITRMRESTYEASSVI